MYPRKQRDESTLRFRPIRRMQILAGLAAMLLCSPAHAVAQHGEPRMLAAGAPLARELSGGQAHSYQVTLAQGQYLEAIIEQRGIDVVVVVFAPDGQKLVEVDSPNGTQGPEPVWIIAETSGEYRLEVRSLEKDAPAGRYDVRIEAPRIPTELDRVRVTALRAFGEASQLRLQGTPEAVRQAVGKYEESLPGWQTVGDRVKEAETLSNLGFLCHMSLGEPLKAREYHERELPLQRALGNQAAEAVALNNLGHIYATLGEMQKALESYGQSLALRRAARDRHGEAVVLDQLGQAYSEMGQLQRALEYQQQALAIFRDLGEPRHEGVALGNLSDTLLRMGENERALEVGNQGLTLVRAAKDELQESIFLNGIGVVYFNLGEGRKALDYYQQALALHRKSGNRHQEAYTLANIGTAFLSLGEYAQALGGLRQALLLHRVSGAKRGEAFTLFHLGAVLRLTGATPEAKESFEAALELSRAIEAPDLEAHIFDALSLLAQARGDLPAAYGYSERAIALTESARAAVAGGQSRAAFFASKQTFYEHFIDVLMEQHRAQPKESRDVAALSVSERARARSLLDLLTEAGADIREGVDASLLSREQTVRQQLNVRAAAQTRLLGGKHTDAQAAGAAKEVAALIGHLQEIEAEVRGRSPRYAALTQPQPLAVNEIQKRLLDDDTLLLEYALGETRSYLWLVSRASVNSYELPPRAEIEAATRGVYDLLTARQPQAGLNERQRAERIKTADAEYPARAAALTRMLLQPVAARLGDKRLVIVASGILEYLPFAALPAPSPDGADRTDAPPLLAEHEVVHLPSASVLAELRREAAARQPAPETIAVFADPVFAAGDPRVGASGANAASGATTAPPALARAVRGDLTRLPFSREEAEAILALAPDRGSLKALSFDASRVTAMRADLGRYRIVHFATHGLLNSEHPDLSGLVLSLVDAAGRPQDGFLRLHEIYNLRLNADLVVLSACQTGLGKQIKGEGLVGLTRGFMYAGAPRIVASLWQVNDLATAELMKRFYQGVLKDGARPAAALRAAQLAMRQQKRWAAPYYWAAFILQGEWR